MQEMSRVSKLVTLALSVGMTFTAPFSYTTLAAMSSPSYSINWDTIGTGGDDTSSSASYTLRDTIGNAAIGDATSTSYQLKAGYRQGVVDQAITFRLLPQLSTSSVSASDLTGNTVTVSSTTGYSVGNYVLIIQDQGASQVSGLGKVLSKTGTTLTLDSIATNGVTPVLDGSNDFVYELSGSSVAFGTLTQSVIKTTSVGFEITTDSTNGYSVQVEEDGNLRSGTDEVTPVADGSVTIGSDETGAISSDTSLASSTFDTQDTALTTSFQPIVTQSSAIVDDRHFLTLKAAIDSTVPSGDYAQTLTFITTGNY